MHDEISRRRPRALGQISRQAAGGGPGAGRGGGAWGQPKVDDAQHLWQDGVFGCHELNSIAFALFRPLAVANPPLAYPPF